MKKIILLTIIAVTIISGCLSEPDFDIERRLSIEFFAEEMGEPIVGITDTLVINEFKFMIDRFRVETIDESIVEPNEGFRPFLFSFQKAFSNNFLVLEAPLGVVDIGAFNQYWAKVERIRPSDMINDTDFFGSGETFSLVLRGTYNGAPFETKTKTEFEVDFEFTPVQLTNDKETLLIVKSLNMKDVFINSATGDVIDPADEANWPIFEEQFRNSLKVNVTAITSFR